jgi:hypothetical protein
MATVGEISDALEGASSASTRRSMSETLLAVEHLTTGFDVQGRFVPAVIDVSFRCRAARRSASSANRAAASR